MFTKLNRDNLFYKSSVLNGSINNNNNNNSNMPTCVTRKTLPTAAVQRCNQNIYDGTYDFTPYI